MGVANDHSIAWGIAEAAANAGAELAFTYQTESFERRVKPLAESMGAKVILPCDVVDDYSLDAVFDEIAAVWGTLDFVVHSVAYSDKTELSGAYSETTRENFLRTLDISCYSFTGIARRASELMGGGGSLVTLTYSGAERVMPNYNVMGLPRLPLRRVYVISHRILGQNQSG